MAASYFILDDIQKPVTAKESVLALAARKLSVAPDVIADLIILRESLDARKKNNLKWVYQAAVQLKSDKAPQGAREYVSPVLDFTEGAFQPKERPIIIGAGPAGLFAAYTLAMKGYQPLILEQGKAVAERSQDVLALWQKGVIDPKSNVVFGEGGAGTFSDGKLTARNRSPETDFFYKTLIKFGAPPEIAYQSKPHLGTDRLSAIIPAITAYLRDKGVMLNFNTKVLKVRRSNDRVVVTTDAGEWSSDCVIAAMGHSADDLFHSLHEAGASIIKKTFAVGVRIEHPRTFIDSWQYGPHHDTALTGPADYKLTSEVATGRGVYSFCVCPGGKIINASSGSGGVSVNGMSFSKRDSAFTNGAIVATVLPEDLPDHPLAGLAYRKEIEKRCAMQGGLFAPCQKAKDFLEGNKSKHIESTYRPGYISEDLNTLLPENITSALKKGFAVFERQIRGFTEKGIIVAPETGTSSPVRLVRDPETFESTGMKGLYPIGEGAGYAGGIVSSAADGIRMGLKFKPK